uniref:Transducin beta-like protein 3 n=1 Tax=Cacopsylla melanoneura TaxID=428564 RepID=A0A8D8WKN6_9HEMI
MSSITQKEIFVPESEHGAFYTGGSVEWSPDGTHLLCQCGNNVKVLSTSTGTVDYSIPIQPLEEDTDDILTFTVGADNDSLITAHKSGLLKLWDWRNGELQKSWKSIHKGPISCLAISSSATGCILASGGSDSSVRLWVLQHHACTHNLKSTQGVVSVVKFHSNPDTDKLELFAAGDEFIVVYDVASGDALFKLQAHFNRITDIDFDLVNNRLVSCGRDKVLITWDLRTRKQLKTIPVYESLEACAVFHLSGETEDETGEEMKPGETGKTYVLTGGEKSILHYYETNGVRELYQSPAFTAPLVRIVRCGVKRVYAVVTADHNISLYKLSGEPGSSLEQRPNKILKLSKQFVGFSDEILDIALLGDTESHIAVASNTPNIQLYSRKDMSCTLVSGHTDFVLALATSLANRNLLLSGSKDNSVRLWLFDGRKSLQCVATAATHTKSITCVALSQLSCSFLVSASQDTTLKLWKFPKKLTLSTPTDSLAHTLEIQSTEIGHEKDINTVAVSPNDKLIASGSLDKTIKVWSTEGGLKLVNVLRGHRKGVWFVSFSPLDRILISSSGDASIKLWCLTDFVCLKSFEGHDASVLRCQFINRGTQIVSTGADGLLKLWSIKSSTCVATFDKHSLKIWTMAITKDENQIITGGADSLLVTWRDATEETVTQRIAVAQQGVMQSQQLDNLINAKENVKALKLALKLERPHTALKILQNIIQEDESSLKQCLNELHEDQKEQLLKCAVNWNTNAKHAYPAQLVLSVLLELQCSMVSKPFQSSLEALLPYTQRHFARLTQLNQDVHFLKYTTALMKS